MTYAEYVALAIQEVVQMRDWIDAEVRGNRAVIMGERYIYTVWQSDGCVKCKVDDTKLDRAFTYTCRPKDLVDVVRGHE